MAKQLVNPFERHVEKGVLCIAGILLLGVIAKYLVTSPSKVELGSAGPAGPQNIDEKVAQKSEAVRQALSQAKPSVKPVDPLADDFAKSAVTLAQLGLVSELPASLPLGPDIPLIDASDSRLEKIKLIGVVGVPKPVTTSGRQLTVESGDEGDREVSVDWVTVSTVFDLRGQTDLQTKGYGSKWRDVYLAPAQLQRRERRADLSWSDEDWKAIESWPVAELIEPPAVPLVSDGKQVVVPKDDFRFVEKFFEFISKPKAQLGFLRPNPPFLPPTAVTDPSWRFPVITSIRDVAVQEDYYLYTEQPKSANPRLDRWPWLDDTPAAPKSGQTPKAANPREEIKKKFAQYKEYLEAAKKNEDENQALLAYNLCIEVQFSQVASKEDKRNAINLAKEAEQLSKDIRLKKTSEKGVKLRPDDPNQPKTIKRDPEPKQQIWAHDAKPGSLVGGRTYQYRIRPVAVNRLLGIPEKFQNPADAQTVLIHGEWSEPSDPVSIEPSLQLFVAGADGGKREATLEVYQWFRGVWVTHRDKFKVGDAIDFVQRKPTPDLDDRDKAHNALVPFKADGILLDIDYDRPARERKVERGGVRFTAPEKGAAVVFADGQGRVREFVEGFDKTDPQRKVNRERVWKAKKP